MDPDSWKRLESVFFEAIELDPAARPAFLDRACAGDADFRREIDAVLAAHEDEGGSEDGNHASSREPEGGSAGMLIGVYKLGERIGIGGMGEVYRAQRVDDQYTQEVAIKLVRSSLLPEEMIRRFRVERQVLARLQHPNVATLLDGGIAPDGRPYLVMQYVAGLPITEYADAQRLSIPDRLQLFATVCRAVQYAHANLVVHRDLKPSNILVTEDGQVRLLDFGIAKLLDPEGVGVTAPLTEEILLLTPEHAAPEQLMGVAVTTATDVYALGVLLYELLTGTRPFRARTTDDLRRDVCEREPTRPSAAVASASRGGGPDSAAVAATRDSRVAGLVNALRGDLDHMVLMALRKEPERRYASAGQFADDVERFLQGRPIVARGDSLRYRASKFYGRNRTGVVAAAAFVLVLVGAAAFSTVQSVSRARALVVAEVERDKAARLSDFLVSVFSASDPNEARGELVTARELLDGAAQRIDDDLLDDPLAQADMALAIGRSYTGLGLVEPARTLFATALQQREQALPPEDPAIAEALEHLGQNLQARGEYLRAIALLEQSLRLREAAFGATDTTVARTLTILGRMEIDAGRYDSAAVLLTRAEEIQRAQNPVDGRALANTLRYRWVAASYLDQPPEEELAIAQEALAVAQAAVGEDDPFVFNVYEDYALALQGMDMQDSAAALHRSLLEKRERVFGPDHPDVAFSLFNLARVVGAGQGQWAEAVPLFERAIRIRERAYGDDHPRVADALHSYSIAVANMGDIDRSADLSARAVTIREAKLDERELGLLDSMELLAQLRALQGRNDDALDLLETLVDRGWWHEAVLEGSPMNGVRNDSRFQALADRRPPAER